jgi:uncharacterized protein YlzI (FlbEa/FlbD family)
MSDALLQSAVLYQEISKYEYYFIFGDKKKNLYYIPIKLKSENYPHLIGIDKLTDKKEFIFKESKERIIDRIINSEITFQQIEDSKQIEDCLNKLLFFNGFSAFFSDNITQSSGFNFLRKTAFSSINASILIKNMNNHDHVFLKYECLDKVAEYYIPISFLNEPTQKYTARQKRLTLLYADRKEILSQSEREVLYKLKSFTDEIIYSATKL